MVNTRTSSSNIDPNISSDPNPDTRSQQLSTISSRLQALDSMAADVAALKAIDNCCDWVSGFGSKEKFRAMFEPEVLVLTMLDRFGNKKWLILEMKLLDDVQPIEQYFRRKKRDHVMVNSGADKHEINSLVG
nr:hypothetical protein [Tanacetum cinerariifolium]